MYLNKDDFMMDDLYIASLYENNLTSQNRFYNEKFCNTVLHSLCTVWRHCRAAGTQIARIRPNLNS